MGKIISFEEKLSFENTNIPIEITKYGFLWEKKPCFVKINGKARLGMEPRRRRPLRERRLKAGKMLRWSILSESPSSCAAKGLSEQGERSQWL